MLTENVCTQGTIPFDSFERPLDSAAEWHVLPAALIRSDLRDSPEGGAGYARPLLMSRIRTSTHTRQLPQAVATNHGGI